jgi:hypothetical protein
MARGNGRDAVCHGGLLAGRRECVGKPGARDARRAFWEERREWTLPIWAGGRVAWPDGGRGAQVFERGTRVFLYTGDIRAGEMAERLKAAVC